ncbi:hypothetical protein Acr_00g0080300 [Actinidia rufa]|uniref:Uncharacterized protein n=1 Tax=Actinidia rufa TaxID=165716 RepID=A0A7J0DU16_9ERIC|nr:hypothetical protein Acr_00g0080300 [Actinidia rufa]
MENRRLAVQFAVVRSDWESIPTYYNSLAQLISDEFNYPGEMMRVSIHPPNSLIWGTTMLLAMPNPPNSYKLRETHPPLCGLVKPRTLTKHIRYPSVVKPREFRVGDLVLMIVVVEIWASNQQSILLGLLGTGPRILKGRPAQTNRNKGPGRGHSKPLRRGDQTKAMTADGVMGRVRGSRRNPRKDEYGKISRRYRRRNWKDRILVEMESLEMILSTLPRPRGSGELSGQYPGSWRADEHSDGGSGELSGDSLARSHGLVLPRSRGFGDSLAF